MAVVKGKLSRFNITPLKKFSV